MSAPAGLRAQITAELGSLSIDVELDTGPGTLVLCGPNGAGKSSLLALLLGARPVKRGRIEVAGMPLLDTQSGLNVPLELRGLGYVPQDYALFPHLTVRQNIAFAVMSRSPEDRADHPQRVDQMLDELELAALATRYPQTLSGGERQRLALARALSVRPRALLLDEPLAALDVHARAEVREFLATHLRKLGLPSLVVTHDRHDARVLGGRIAVLEAGRITQTGSWDELAQRPASRFVAELMG